MIPCSSWKRSESVIRLSMAAALTSGSWLSASKAAPIGTQSRADNTTATLSRMDFFILLIRRAADLERGWYQDLAHGDDGRRSILRWILLSRRLNVGVERSKDGRQLEAKDTRRQIATKSGYLPDRYRRGPRIRSRRRQHRLVFQVMNVRHHSPSTIRRIVRQGQVGLGVVALFCNVVVMVVQILT